MKKNLFTILLVGCILFTVLPISASNVKPVITEKLQYPETPSLCNPITTSIDSNQVTILDEPPGIVWSKTYGGVDADRAKSVQQTSDGGYIVAGNTKSYGAGDFDAWLIKTDGEGNELWNKTYGGTFEDIANCVIETNDGGYAIAGYAEYSQGKCELWIIKTDENGTEVWSK